MYRKLVAKTQYLNPGLPDNASLFSKGICIEPETDEILLKRGTIYTIFEVVGNSEASPALVEKVIKDVLHDSYFQSDNISPIQSLEKAIALAKDKVIHMTNESIRNDLPPTEFNIIAGVLWGNVLYLVQYGTSLCFLVRNGDIKPISTVSEGSFSAASGVIHDGDVVIFCSKEFGSHYPPEKLLSMAIGEQQLSQSEACILMKFTIDTNFSANEDVDFGLINMPKKSDHSKISKFIKHWQNEITSKFAAAKAKKNSVVSTIGTNEPPQKQTTTSINEYGTVNLKLKRPSKINLGFVKKPGFIIILILLGLAISIATTIKNKKPTNSIEVARESTEQNGPKPTVEGAQDIANDKDDEVFYDIKIADPGATPDGIAVFNSVIVVTDSNTGKIYISAQDTAKFAPATVASAGIKNILNIKGKLGFTDNTGYKVYDIANEKVSEEYKQTGLTVASAYLDFVYAISGDKILRYSKEDSTLTESLWGQSADFEGAKSISVAYSIYIIKKDNTIAKYAGGKKESFEIDYEKLKLLSPVQILADIDFDNVYVADPGSKRVLVLSDDGKLIKEIKPKNERAWQNIKYIGVSPDEKTLYVLDGSRVYKMAL